MTITISTIIEAIAETIPDRPALIHGKKQLSFSDLVDRERRLANFLISQNITIHTDRAKLENWQSGQDHVALYMYNCSEYLECLVGCARARAVPFNINFRYVGEELIYLFSDAKPKVVIYQSTFAQNLAEVLPSAPSIELLIQVDDGTAVELLPNAVWYHDILAGSNNNPPQVVPSEDDIYCMYTGGTTGMPKGVLWRQCEVIHSSLGGTNRDGSDITDIDDFVQRAKTSIGYRVLPAPPFMHGGGTQASMAGWLTGNTVVIQESVVSMDPADLLRTIERDKVNMLMIIGDAYGRPLVKEAQAGNYDLSSVRFIYQSGAVLSQSVKQQLHELMPKMSLIDALGSTETGPQAKNVSSAESIRQNKKKFDISDDTTILNEMKTATLQPGADELGWIARSGHVPLGYLGDENKTNETFPVLGGVRYVVGGDRVRLLVNGEIELHGRESFVINSGGEKIFAEEVESAIKHHPDVTDVVVTGRPHEKWGNEVVAIVQLESGVKNNRESLLKEAEKHIARYKLPKAFLFHEAIQRGPSGKTDSQWAKSVAGSAS